MLKKNWEMLSNPWQSCSVDYCDTTENYIHEYIINIESAPEIMFCKKKSRYLITYELPLRIC